MGESSVIGRLGRVIVATRGRDGAGEISVQIRGSRETFLAWSEVPVAAGTEVIVVDVRDLRTVVVQQFPGPSR
jgi:membrane protein implicated in regulation of membrane protease activity